MNATVAEPNVSTPRIDAAQLRQQAVDLIKADEWPLEQLLQLEICEINCEQRERVAKFGHCAGGCDYRNFTTNNITGQVVCRWTWQPCPSNRLAALIQMYSIINREEKAHDRSRNTR